MVRYLNNSDVIYETIAIRIIKKYDKTEVKYIIPKYKNPDNPNNPIFTINAIDLSPPLLKKIEVAKVWQDMIGHVSPETYTARIILYSHAKNPLPIFCSKNTFRIKQLIQELDNKFSSNKTREELINHFCKFKQTYWAFTKLARIWKVKRTPIRIQTDLYMNELDPKNTRTFQLIHPKGIYLFSLQNLARIIVDAITHQSGMFVEPLSVKNPYTNAVLPKCDLFNIYFALQQNHIRIHEMLEKFFRCEFNIFEFRRKHETELRDLAIDQYAKTASPEELAQDVDDMFRIHKMKKNLTIAQGFPQKTLVETMRPFLCLYLLERFSFSSMKRKYSAKQLDIMLNQFAEKNPTYGQLIPLDFSSSPNSNLFSTKDQHIKQVIYVTESSFQPNYCKSNYMETHIYDENIFDRYVEMGDSLKTYTDSYVNNDTLLIPLQLNDPPITTDSIYEFSTPSSIISQINSIRNIQLNNASIYFETPVHQDTLALLNRIGILPSISEYTPTSSPEEIRIDNRNIQNTNEYDAESEEDNDEEVIQTNDNDSDSDTEWTNETMEDGEEDSVS